MLVFIIGHVAEQKKVLVVLMMIKIYKKNNLFSIIFSSNDYLWQAIVCEKQEKSKIMNEFFGDTQFIQSLEMPT